MPRSSSITLKILSSLHKGGASLQKFGTKIKSLDGIDEVATILAQILPGLAGPAVAFSVLGLAIPFVYLGALGMKGEFEEACEEYDTIFTSNQDTGNKLKAIQQCSEHWRQVIAKKAGLSISNQSFNTASHASLEEVATLLQQFEEGRNKQFIAAFDKKYGWLGAVGMGGMLIGLFPSTTAAGIAIADKVGTISPMAMAAGQGLMVASGATFLGGQAAMFFYAYNRLERGKATEKQLLETKHHFTQHANGISTPTRTAIHEILDKDIHFNRKHSIEYGRNTMIGQGAMMTGTILGLSGVASIVSLPFLAVGAPMTIAPAISRIVYEDKEEAFRGDKELPYAAKRMTTLGVINQEAVRGLDQEFQHSSDKLARVKLYSLLNHLINDSKYRNYTPEKKLSHLQEMAKTGKLSYLKGSALQGDILTRAQAIIEHEEDEIRDLLLQKKDVANERLQKKIERCAQEDDILTALNVKEKYQAKEKYQKEGGPVLNSKLISHLKRACKSIRYDLAGKLIQATHCLALQAEIQPRSQPHSFSERIRPAANALISPRSASDALHSYAALKEALAEHTDNFHYQQQKLEQFKQRATAFYLADERVNEAGNRVYIWDDPLHSGEEAYRITYVVNKHSKQITVTYGTKASAIIAADAHPASGRGVKMIDIEDGCHVVLGDSNNHAIHVAHLERNTLEQATQWMNRFSSRLYGGSRENLGYQMVNR